MKHIGIVACSAEGAALCHAAICRDALVLVGKNDHPRITLDSIPMVVPEAEDFAMVDRIIFAELVDGIFSGASRQAYYGAIARLRDRGCDGVALACTEIPLLVRPEESPLPTLDSTRLLAKAALMEALR